MLPGISTEQLRSRLNRLVADGLLSRQRYREVPPRVDYELTARARDLLPVIGALSRWGARWAWGPPAADEAVDIGAILRSLPGIESNGLSGVLELSVFAEQDERQYTLTVAASRIKIEEQPAENADAYIRGAQGAWVTAFSPTGDTTSLEISGNAGLAADFLAMIAPGAIQNASIA